MAITYPLSLPSTPGIMQIRMGMNFSVAVSESPWTYSQQVYENQGARWWAEVLLPPMYKAQAEAWVGFMLALNGRLGTFLLGDPFRKTALGDATGTPLVNGASQTGKTLATDGWTPNVTGILKAGDYIQLGTGSTSRLHKVVQDASSDVGGAASLEIQPRLRASPANNDPITVSNCKGLFRLAENKAEWTTRDFLYGVSFSAVEALS